MKQYHIKYNLFARVIKLLHTMKYDIVNNIVSDYLCSATLHVNANTVIGNKNSLNSKTITNKHRMSVTS